MAIPQPGAICAEPSPSAPADLPGWVPHQVLPVLQPLRPGRQPPGLLRRGDPGPERPRGPRRSPVRWRRRSAPRSLRPKEPQALSALPPMEPVSAPSPRSGGGRRPESRPATAVDQAREQSEETGGSGAPMAIAGRDSQPEGSVSALGGDHLPWAGDCQGWVTLIASLQARFGGWPRHFRNRCHSVRPLRKWRQRLASPRSGRRTPPKGRAEGWAGRGNDHRR